MPIPVKKYYCQYRCGRKASDFISTKHHEYICFKNPETKSCMTCGHYKINNGYGDELNSVECTLKKLKYVNFSNYNELWQGDNQETIWSDEKNGTHPIFSNDKFVDSDRIFPTTNCKDWIIQRNTA